MPRPSRASTKTVAVLCPTCGSRLLAYRSQTHTSQPTCSRRCAAVARTGFRSAKLRHDYFSRIDEHNKAYIFGLALADGNVSRPLRHWCIDLHQDDSALLLEVGAELGLKLSHLPVNRKDHTVRLKITSRQQASDLSSLGCTPNKTYEHSPIVFPPGDLERSFWRGFFDGDGSVSCDPSGGSYTLTIASSHPDLPGRLQHIAQELGIFYQHETRPNLLRVTAFHGQDAQRFAAYIQDTPGLRLSRKADGCARLRSLSIKRRITTKRCPPGQRWCGRCQAFRPEGDFYESSRCKNCSRSRALDYYHRRCIADHGKEKAMVEAASKQI